MAIFLLEMGENQHSDIRIPKSTRDWTVNSGLRGFFSKVIFLKLEFSNEKDEVCHSYLLKIFTKSLHKEGVATFSE